MRIAHEQLPARLKDLASTYLISGDETLLVGEASDAVRAAARAHGFSERQVFFAARYFDWNEVRTAAQSLSLFASLRVLDIRMPSGKPEAGAAVLLEIIEQAASDVLTLIVTDKLDKKAADAPWVRAVEAKGVHVAIGTVASDRLPQWLKQRATQRGLNLQDDAAQLIAERSEGNLLAADQEITKLALLAPDSTIDAEMALKAVSNNARYDVYQLSAAALAGDAPRALHILAGLRSEGTEPTLILWALTREVRGLWNGLERQRLRSNSRGLPWNLAATPSPQALSRARKLPVARLLAQAGATDRVIKGASRGNAWEALTALTAALSGALPSALLADASSRPRAVAAIQPARRTAVPPSPSAGGRA